MLWELGNTTLIVLGCGLSGAKRVSSHVRYLRIRGDCTAEAGKKIEETLYSVIVIQAQAITAPVIPLSAHREIPLAFFSNCRLFSNMAFDKQVVSIGYCVEKKISKIAL